MVDRPDITELFTPVDQSASLIFLRRILGCTFDYLWVPGGGSAPSGGACDNTNDILAQLVTTLNWAMLAVIAVVATYLIYASLKDTANDGEAGGRSTNPSWTLVLAGVGAIACFPAFNGFNALQIGAMQVAVWSSGLGDQLWKTAGAHMANANTVNAAFVSKGSDGWFFNDPATEKSLREQIAAGLAARVAGEICRTTVTKSTASMATPEGEVTTITPLPTTTSDSDGYVQTVLTYRAGKGLGNSVGLCGGVSVSYATEKAQLPAQSNGTLTPDNLGSQAELSRALARFQARAAKEGADALISAIQSEGDSLHKTLFPENGVRLSGPEQMAAIERAVKNTIDTAKKAMKDAVAQAPAEFKQHTSAAMAGNQNNGWFYAVLYQRVLVNATSTLSQLGLGGTEVRSNKPVENLGRAIGCEGFLLNQCSNELNVFFRQYKSDLDALAQMEGTFQNASANSSTYGVNAESIGNANSGGGLVSQSLNKAMLSLAGVKASEGQGWTDPIPQIQDTGSNIIALGSSISAVAAGGSVVSSVAKGTGVGIVGELVSSAGIVGYALLGIGFILAVIVPYMPIIYFFLAALSWLIMAVQMIIFAPFWIMQMFYPNRGGGLQGTSIARALSLLLALLMRPALIIIGLIFCMQLMRVGADYLTAIFLQSFNLLSYSGPNLISSFSNMFLAVGSFLLYMSAIVALVAICCGLIDGLGDAVMEAIESGLSRFQGSLGQRGEGMLGSPTAAAAALGASMGARGRGALAGTTKQIADRYQSRLGGSRK